MRCPRCGHRWVSTLYHGRVIAQDGCARCGAVGEQVLEDDDEEVGGV
jgi:transcription elongation factor Elf1